MRPILLFLCCWVASPLFSQKDSLGQSQPDHRRFYFYWGYNRDWFTHSDLHFSGPNYDFTVYNVSASDRPDRLGWIYLDPRNLSIPQYNYRIGYRIGKQIFLSLGLDHMKYVVNTGQVVAISGVVNSSASIEYAGNYRNTPIKLSPKVLLFEHTNGFNLAEADIEWVPEINKQGNKRKPGRLYGVIGTGLSGIITKTDVKIFGDGLDNDFKISGLAGTAKVGFRLEWRRRWFLNAEAKGGYANLPWVPIKNEAPERADHQVFFCETVFAAGVRF